MSTFSRRLMMLALALGLGALLVACNGDGSAKSSPSPGSTAAPTEAPSPPSGAPRAPAPPFQLNVEVLGLGEMTVTLGAGETYQFDPIQLAEADDLDVPPCAGFLFLLGWQVQDPYPADDVSLRVDMTRMGATEEIGSGSVGSVKVGCGVIDVINDSATQVKVEMRYGFGQIKE